MVYNVSKHFKGETKMKESAKKNTLSLVTAALFTALTVVCSQIAIPMPTQVSLTLQTFAVALCGYVLGIKWGLASIITYVLLGTVGIPVFSGFKGGVQVLFGASGGFIFGFIFFVLLCGVSLLVKNKALKLIIGLGGLVICHILGVIQFAVVYKTDLISSFLMVSAPYLIKDVISVAAAFFLSLYIRKLLTKIHL